jgi:site-specific recombinase XerD
VLNLDLADLSATARAKRGPRLPTVLSVPETTALLGAMRGTPWLMAALIYGGGLRVTECCQDPRTGLVRRHHVSDSVVQKAVKAAAREAKIHKPTSVHTLRHCFGTHLLLSGVDIRQIQEYLGHTNVETTMVYTHVVKELRTPPRSPLDALQAARR